MTREHDEPVDPVEAGLGHRRGVVVEAVDPRRRFLASVDGRPRRGRPDGRRRPERQRSYGAKTTGAGRVTGAALTPTWNVAIRRHGMPYDRFSQTDTGGVWMTGASCRRLPVGGSEPLDLERDPVGRPPLSLRSGVDRHDDDGGRLGGLRRAGTQRAWIRSPPPGGGRLGAGARAPRQLLPARPGALAEWNTIWAEYFPAPRPAAGRRSSPGSRSRAC